jgi:hypothetical protein
MISPRRHLGRNDAKLTDLAKNLTVTAAQLNAAVAQLAGQTPSDAEVNVLDGAIASVTFVVAAGAANVCVLTGTIKDADGATIASRKALRVYISEAATGAGVSADSYSTGASVTTGSIVATVTANKVWDILTHSDGTFAISITDTAKPVDQYLVAITPITGGVNVSAASAALWGA